MDDYDGEWVGVTDQTSTKTLFETEKMQTEETACRRKITGPWKMKNPNTRILLNVDHAEL